MLEAGGADVPVDPARARRMVAQHFDFIWRTVRRFGVDADGAEDAAQEVLLVASRKMGSVAEGSERAFLFGVAVRVASSDRRTKRRHPDRAGAEVFADVIDAAPLADELLDKTKARAVLDRLLDELSLELRTALVLFEIEEMTTAEIAALLELPMGTVASRLRRGREQLEAGIARYRARSSRSTGGAR